MNADGLRADGRWDEGKIKCSTSADSKWVNSVNINMFVNSLLLYEGFFQRWPCKIDKITYIEFIQTHFSYIIVLYHMTAFFKVACNFGINITCALITICLGVSFFLSARLGCLNVNFDLLKSHIGHGMPIKSLGCHRIICDKDTTQSRLQPHKRIQVCHKQEQDWWNPLLSSSTPYNLIDLVEQYGEEDSRRR